MSAASVSMSNRAPNSLAIPVRRASQPSRPSSTPITAVRPIVSQSSSGVAGRPIRRATSATSTARIVVTTLAGPNRGYGCRRARDTPVLTRPNPIAGARLYRRGVPHQNVHRCMMRPERSGWRRLPRRDPREVLGTPSDDEVLVHALYSGISRPDRGARVRRARPAERMGPNACALSERPNFRRP
jgi:hypothetical protein